MSLALLRFQAEQKLKCDVEDESDSDFSWWLVLVRIGGPIRRHYCNYVIFWALIWATCVVCLIAFSWEVFAQYREENPITVITFSDLGSSAPPLKVKVCNSYYLDPEKILNYNGTDLKIEAYQYLHEAASGNHQFNDTGSVYKNDMRYFLSVSSRVYSEFALDVDQFLLTCSWSGIIRKKCSSVFAYVQEPLAVCYETIIEFGGLGAYNSFNLFFYFNTSKALGKYTKSVGAHVIISDPDDFLSLTDSTFIQPNDFSKLSLKVIHKQQTRSFQKAKCVHKYGTDTYNFTGEPFSVTYNPYMCKELCYSEMTWKYCKCVPRPVLNLTVDKCLENETNRRCVNDHQIYEENKFWIDNCQSKCLGKCNKKLFKLLVQQENWSVSPKIVSAFLEELVNDEKTDNLLARQLLAQIAQSNNQSSEVEAISKNIAQCSIYLMANEPIENIEILEMVTFPTFICNIGGLLGMWLGLSVISAVEMLQNWLQKLFWGFKMFRKKPIDKSVTDASTGKRKSLSTQMSLIE